MIHCENVSDVYSNGKMSLWLLSAFKAGFINSAGFLITGKFVSHVTGFGTQIGMALGHSHIFFGAELLIIPCSFIMGGIITSFILENPKHKNEIPPYHFVQGLITFLIAIILVAGEAGIISDKIHFNNDKGYDFIGLSLISLLCLISGLKNSLVTWTTHGKIRVTHLTGISTDIGLNLINMFYPKRKTARTKEKKRINAHRIATLVAFSIGAFISAIIFPRIGHKAFYIVFIISLFITILSFSSNREKRKMISL